MSPGEARDAVLLLCMVAMVAAVLLRGWRAAPVLPPVVAPQEQPLGEQVRDVRHRVANVEQQVPQLGDHAMRIRTLEAGMAAQREAMAGLERMLGRIGHQVDLLVAHQLNEEKQ